MQEPSFRNPDAMVDETRYSRQMLFAGVGAGGQQKLGRARLAVVGVGATGAASAALMARAGVGRMLLIDRDFVEESNLQRQMLFTEADAAAAMPKAEAARRHIAEFNSGIAAEARVTDLVPENIAELLDGVDLVLDCTDNFETRYLLNDYAVSTGKPWIYAGAVGAEAAGMTVLPRTQPGAPGETACLACLFPLAPAGAVATCETAGILGMAVNLAASVQCAEALKILTEQRELVRRTFFLSNLWRNTRAEIATAVPDPSCRVCGLREFEHLAGGMRPHITLCGRNSVQIHEQRRPVDLVALERTLALQPEVSRVRGNAMLLRFTRGPLTVSVFPDGRALIQGTTDTAVARSVYARFLGN